MTTGSSTSGSRAPETAQLAKETRSCVESSCTHPAMSGWKSAPDPTILAPTDAIIRLSHTCICGSDLWPWRGLDDVSAPMPMGHEYAGIVEDVGSDVTNIGPGQFVVGSFFASDNTCAICQAGYQTSCIHRVGMGSEGAQAELLRVPLADGTLVATPEHPARGSGPELPGRLRCTGDRLVRRRSCRGRPRQDGRRRWRWRGRSPRRSSPRGISVPSASSR